MNYGEGGLSASDVALLSNSGRNNDGWGNDGGAWWIIIFLIFALGGFGNNGWGNRGNQGGAADNYTLASDFASLQRQLDSGFDRNGQMINQVNQGLCDRFLCYEHRNAKWFWKHSKYIIPRFCWCEQRYYSKWL